MTTTLKPQLIPILLKGLFELKTPFKCTPTVIYTVEATRTIDEMLLDNVDVFNEVYKPKGLTEKDYEKDKESLEHVITLTSLEEPPIYVPSSYILKYPDDSAIRYEHIVLSCSLGALPTSVSDQLQQLIDVIEAAASDLTGAEKVTVTLSTAPSTNAITVEQHRVAERNRISRIKRRETEHAANIKLTEENAQLKIIIKDLEDKIISLSGGNP